MTGRQKRTLIRIVMAALLFAGAVSLPTGGWLRLISFLIPYGVIGWDVLWRACRNIGRGQIFDENFLMALATLGALAIGEYPEAVAVMLFYQVGELFQSCAVGRSRRSIAQLMDICPNHANVEGPEGLKETLPEEVSPGEVIVIKAGERIPLDGVVLEGSSFLDTAALTGESLPRQVQPGDEVISGCVNTKGVLRVRVSRPYEDSTVARILELVENAGSRKAKMENFITRFAGYYTPAVVAAALLLAVLPPLVTGGGWTDWLYRALTFLVISCPCALVISVPMTFFGGIGCASRHGILIKGGNYLEALASVDTVVFDKTGTLTQGLFQVTGLQEAGADRQRLLELAGCAEYYSDHPIAAALRRAWGGEPAAGRVSRSEELPGKGVRAVVDGELVLVGSASFLEEAGIRVKQPESAGTLVHVAVGEVYAGYLVAADLLKTNAAGAIEALRQAGVCRAVMLTGDREEAAKETAAQLHLDAFHAGLMPQDKVALVEQLLAEQTPGRHLAFVGDGINDAPVLSRADVGIAMGALGSDAAIEAADVVLMDDDPEKIPLALRIAGKTVAIARQNVVFALGVKCLILILGALGLANMWWAVFGDVGVAVLAILNAMRALSSGGKK